MTAPGDAGPALGLARAAAPAARSLWTADGPHDELRDFFIGNSSVQGHPQRIEDTATARLTSLWQQAGVPARAYNFGFATTNG